MGAIVTQPLSEDINIVVPNTDEPVKRMNGVKGGRPRPIETVTRDAIVLQWIREFDPEKVGKTRDEITFGIRDAYGIDITTNLTYLSLNRLRVARVLTRAHHYGAHRWFLNDPQPE